MHWAKKLQKQRDDLLYKCNRYYEAIWKIKEMVMPMGRPPFDSITGSEERYPRTATREQLEVAIRELPLL